MSDPEVLPADPPHLLTESRVAAASVSEPSNGPSAAGAPSVSVEDPASTPPPIDLLQFSGTREPTEDTLPAQDVEDAGDKVEPSEDPPCSHEQDGEEPEE